MKNRPKRIPRAVVGDVVKIVLAEGEQPTALRVVEIWSAWETCEHRFVRWRDENVLVVDIPGGVPTPYIEHDCVFEPLPRAASPVRQ